MDFYNGSGNKISISEDSSEAITTHTVVKTGVVAGTTTGTVNVEGYIEGTLILRGGGSFMPYKVYDKDNNILIDATSWGEKDTINLNVSGATTVELKPTKDVTVVWKVNEKTTEQLPDDYRDGRVLVWHDEFDEDKLDSAK